jgi:hypothetical protein
MWSKGLTSPLSTRMTAFFVVNEAADEQSYYLTWGEGKLRKLASVKASNGGVRPITEKDKKEFENEKQFWIDRLALDSRSK